MVSPALPAARVATFTGGFKREHGAFKYGDLATFNHGSHYGFIEEGVVFSKLQPGLATLYRARRRRGRHEDLDGSGRRVCSPGSASRARTACRWSSRTRKPARRRPAPWSPDGDPATGRARPTTKLRTLRAGACLQETGGKRFLIYGYFSTATPSAMARVFQAYGCRYAMLLDMNALEHTYLALYVAPGRRRSMSSI